MATLTATTYAELAGYIASSSDGDFIQLANDINIDREYPLGVDAIDLTSETAKSITISGAHAPEFVGNTYYSESDGQYTLLQAEPQDWNSNYGNYFKFVDGAYIPVEAEHYRIINLRNAANVTNWIKTNGNVDLEYIDFPNMNMGGCHFLTVTNDGFATDITHCRFTGTRSGQAFLFNIPNGKTLTCVSCAFDIPWNGMGVSSSSTTLQWTSLTPKVPYSGSSTALATYSANYCRFHEHYTGWSQKSTGVDLGDYPFSCEAFKMNGCYIYGDMQCSISTTVKTSTIELSAKIFLNPTNVYNANPNSAQNIFDVEIRATSSNTDTTKEIVPKCEATAFYGIMRNTVYVNSAGHPDYERVYDYSSSGSPRAIIVNDNEFMDDEKLFEKGFDIVFTPEE